MDDAVKKELMGGGGGFYKPGSLPLESPVEITVIDYCKNTDTKYPIAGEDYCWRFKLASGEVLDVSNNNRRALLAGMHQGGSADMKPARFMITNIGKVINKQPSWKAEYVGPAEDVAPSSGLSDDVPF